jgi:hypothetical protein
MDSPPIGIQPMATVANGSCVTPPRLSALLVGPAATCYHHCPLPPQLLHLDALSSLVQGDESLLYSAMFCWVLKLAAAAATTASSVTARREGG